MKKLCFIAVLVCLAVSLPAQFPDKPAWTVRKPQDTAEMSYFTSLVDEFITEEESLRSAINNVNNAVANNTIVYIRSSVSERSRSTESQEAFSINIETDSYTDIVLSGIKIETYSEWYVNRNNQRRYRAWALAVISKARIEENRRAYLETIAKRYALDPAIDRNNLGGALSAYSGVYHALLENPLHRTLAVYGDGQSLFEHCRLKINEIAGSVSVDEIPPQSVQKGGALTVPVRLSSPLFPNAGALECAVVIRSGNRVTPAGSYTVSGDNSFLLRLSASALEAGNYQVNLELALNSLSSAVARNPQTSFRLEVRPATAEIKFEGETLSQAERRSLSQAVQQALQTYRVPLSAGYEFLVAFEIRKTMAPFAGTDILLCDISVSLCSAESVLLQSAPERITEISRDQALKLAADYIRNNREFWTGAAQITNNK
ncbi:MAG: hypothetical protein LBL20_06490 [Treponema sp.]|jgi:hypothetical protein|nr:hypothetical protein [Treponema sp.]